MTDNNHEYSTNDGPRHLISEVNRRRGEMAGIRETLKDAGMQDGSILQMINELIVYKKAMDSMASQFLCPKKTGLELAKQQLGIK